MSKSLFLSNFVRYSTQLSPKTPYFTFVPKHAPVTDREVDLLREFVEKSEKILVVTGAGISTESGIPDYRSEDVGLYARSNHRPVQYREFMTLPSVRQRYWARNYLGWARFSTRVPNETHKCVSELEKAGKLIGIVTQNVDGLHSKAGSNRVIELHGTSFKVVCQQCRTNYHRKMLQKVMMDMNPHMISLSSPGESIRPDGDVEISLDKIEAFKPPLCDSCGGFLKPDIVFFGDNVPKSRVDAVRHWVSESDSILVLGSSLSVFSGYRIILQGVEEGKSIAIVNIGPTRGDQHCNLKISARCGDILPKIVPIS